MPFETQVDLNLYALTHTVREFDFWTAQKRNPDYPLASQLASGYEADLVAGLRARGRSFVLDGIEYSLKGNHIFRSLPTQEITP